MEGFIKVLEGIYMIDPIILGASGSSIRERIYIQHETGNK